MLEECRFVWELSLFIVSLTLNCIASRCFCSCLKWLIVCTEKTLYRRNFPVRWILLSDHGLVISLLVSEDLKSSISFESCQFNRLLRIYRGVLVHDFFDLARFVLRRRQKEKENRPANSHGFTVRLTVWGINSRSHDLASKSHGVSENLIPANFLWFIGVTFLSWECRAFSYGTDNIRRCPTVSEDVRRFPKMSDDFRRRSEDFPIYGQ